MVGEAGVVTWRASRVRRAFMYEVTFSRESESQAEYSGASLACMSARGRGEEDTHA